MLFRIRGQVNVAREESEQLRIVRLPTPFQEKEVPQKKESLLAQTDIVGISEFFNAGRG